MPAQEGIGQYLSRRLLPLAAGIGLLLAVSPPLTYWILEHHAVQHTADMYAEELANDFQRLARDSPGLWKYQTYKFTAMTEGFHPIADVAGFRVLDEKGEAIAGYEYKSVGTWPGAGLAFREDLFVTLGAAPIRFNNRQVGTVEVLVSDDPIWRTAAVIAGLSFLAGSTLAALAFLFPVRVVKGAEEEILRLNKALELRVRERTQQLLDAQEELVRKEKLSTLGQLAGSVGHELRNPLGVMNNAVYFLQTVLTSADETTREYLGIIKSEIAGAERIVSDLLDAGRTRPPHPQPVSAEELLRMSLEKCRVPENIILDLQAETQLPVFVDPFQMKQVFINLINNAADAMPGGGSLKIRVRSTNGEGGSTGDEGRGERVARPLVEISVADTGAGIAPENLAKLFQPLFTTKARGIGLGLVVVKNLTEANGGTVRVASEAGKGAVFTVAVPGSEV